MAKPWQPEDYCHPFQGALVERIVPAVSGVYGLHTRRQQLFIGEAADLREALLQHRKEAEKLFQGREPSYFSFEICETNLRANRAQALIAEYRPSIQALRPLSMATLPSTKSTRKVMEMSASQEKTSTPTPQWPEAPSTSEPDALRQPSYFSRSQIVTLGMSFLITATVSGLFGFMSGKKLALNRQAALQLAAARRPILAHRTDEGSQSNAQSEDTNADSVPAESEPSAGKAAAVVPLKAVSATAHDGEAAVGKAKNKLEANALNVNQPDPAEPKPATNPAAKKDLTTNIWSVQISATQDRTAAQLLQDRLKSKGFEAFIVEIEISSNRWYRVRVGRFPTRQEAEKTRQDLQSKENLANAFVTAK
jgi:cell division septation protein DedD